MRNLVCGVILLIAVATAKEPTLKHELSATKEVKNINKRYILTIPQYNSLFYTNRQVLPIQQVFTPNSQAIANYINSLQLSNDVPNYYALTKTNNGQIYSTQKVIPQIQNFIQSSAPQHQQLVQQIVPQQQVVPRQQVVPQQQIVLQQRILPQQQSVPDHVHHQQVVHQQQVIPPQDLPQHRVIPQQLVQQQVLPQQIISQRLQPQQPVQQQISPQQTISQEIVPQQVRSQQVTPQELTQEIRYQPQLPRPQAIINKQQYSYGLPPGQNTLPLFNEKQHVPGDSYVNRPVHVRLQQPLFQVQSVPKNPANVFYNVPISTPYNSISHLQQGQIHSQPQTVYVHPNLQTNPGIAQQVVRIGYGSPGINQENIIQTSHPQIRYIHPSTQESSGGQQQVVRIGYGYPNPNEGDVQDQNDVNSQQRVKLAVPVSYEIPVFYVPQKDESRYQYRSFDRSTRASSISDKNELKPKEADFTKK